MKTKILIFLLSLFNFYCVFSQTKEQRQIITKDYNSLYLTQLAESFRQKEVSEKTKALQLAKEKAWRVKYEENGSFFELMKVSEEGKPIYYRTFNADAAISTRANTLNSGG